jgi:hypothetical protein
MIGIIMKIFSGRAERAAAIPVSHGAERTLAAGGGGVLRGVVPE